MKIIEFKRIPFEREKEYFDDGFASWKLKWKGKTWFVNAIYSLEAQEKNANTKDFSNGIKALELTDSKYKVFRKFPIAKNATVVNTTMVEDYLVKYW